MAKLMTDGAINTCFRILAKENLTISTGDYQTAFIDLDSRCIYLPRWEDVSQDVADLLRAHEVSHALNTPVQGWHSSIKAKNDKRFAGYLNVIEDSRIERMIRQKFGGLKPIFERGYQDIVDYGIFDSPVYGKIRELKDFGVFNLIDRINLQEKIGAHTNVPFRNDTEKRLLLRTQTARTWKEVAQIAEEVFLYDRDNPSELDLTIRGLMGAGEDGDEDEGEGGDGFKVAVLQDGDEGQDSDQSGSGDSSDGNESDGEGDPSSSQSDDGDQSGDNSESGETGSSSLNAPSSELPSSLTDDAFRKNEANMGSQPPENPYEARVNDRKNLIVLRPKNKRVVNE